MTRRVSPRHRGRSFGQPGLRMTVDWSDYSPDSVLFFAVPEGHQLFDPAAAACTLAEASLPIKVAFWIC